MREIKFRAWDKNDSEMYDVAYINYKNKLVHIEWFAEPQYGGKSAEMRDVYLMQYTGLKDKNSKEIYSGDILSYADISSDEWFMDKQKTIGVVKWRELKCGFAPQEIKQNHKRGHYFAYWDQIHDIEIIGNIYENPELLEQE